MTSVAGMSTIVYGFIRAATEGWGDPITIGAFGAGLVLVASFLRIERVAQQPITPLRLFASRTRTGACSRMLTVGGMFSMFFFLTSNT